MAKIVFLFADHPPLDWNSSYWRCFLPAKYLSVKHSVSLAHFLNFPAHTDNDVFVVERAIFGPVFEAVKRMKELGKKVIITLDDCYHKLPDFLPSRATWTKDKLQELTDAIGFADATIVPSKELRDFYKQYGRVELVENYYPDEWFDIPLKAGEFDLGWSGSASHMLSWRNTGLARAIKQNNWTFLLNCGTNEKMVEMLDGLYSAYQPWTKQKDYCAVVDRFKVGLAPLASDYDQYRSNIKVLLYAIRGRPWVATQYKPYLEAQGGIPTDNTSNAWTLSIKSAFEHYDDLVQSGREWSYGYRMSANLAKYEELL